MVINKNGLITENQNTTVEENVYNEEIQKNGDINYNFDLKSNNQILSNKNINSQDYKTENNNISNEQYNTSNNFESNYNTNLSINVSDKNYILNEYNKNLENANNEVQTDQNSFSQESIQDSSLDEKETVETNCLALTVRKDYNFAIAKNTVFKTIRMSIKVAISTFLLNLIKLFF